MIKILFVCLGNICRSPMAEFILKDMIQKRGLEGEIEVASAATSWEEIGNSIYPPAKRALIAHNVPYMERAATRITKQDYAAFDRIIAMERRNITAICRITGGDPEGKIRLLLDYTDCPGDIADPWYTGNFELTYQQITAGCLGLLEDLGF